VYEETEGNAGRRAKFFAYLLLVAGVLAFGHELGRQHGFAQANADATEREDRHEFASKRMADELGRLRAADHAEADAL